MRNVFIGIVSATLIVAPLASWTGYRHGYAAGEKAAAQGMLDAMKAGFNQYRSSLAKPATRPAR